MIDSNWKARLADFGLSVFVGGGSQQYASVRGGAVQWLSPELLDPEEYGSISSRPTFAADIYSFACVCIEVSFDSVSMIRYDILTISKYSYIRLNHLSLVSAMRLSFPSSCRTEGPSDPSFMTQRRCLPSYIHSWRNAGINSVTIVQQRSSFSTRSHRLSPIYWVPIFLGAIRIS